MNPSADVAAYARPRTMVLIPAYKPSFALTTLVRRLLASNAIEGIVVVDDGSGPQSHPVFDDLGREKRVHVLTHPKNRGKGAALKTGFHFIAQHCPQFSGVVTADADGQHTYADILKVARELQKRPRDLVFGARSFDHAVPTRSRFGNLLTRRVLEIVFGQKLSDTQTGLRGIPADLVAICAALRHDGYDYELEMILTMKKLGRKIRELSIRTIYIDNNKSSHFKPLLDSLRIYSVFLRFAGSSLLSTIKTAYIKPGRRASGNG